MKMHATFLFASVLATLTGCGKTDVLDLRHQGETSNSAALALSNSSSCTTNTGDVDLLAKAQDTLAAGSATLTAMTGVNYGGHRLQAIHWISWAQNEAKLASDYIVKNGSCGPSTDKENPIINTMLVPPFEDANAKKLHDVGDQLVSVINTLRVTIRSRDFGGHRANAAYNGLQALSELSLAETVDVVYTQKANTNGARGNDCSYLVDSWGAGFFLGCNAGGDVSRTVSIHIAAGSCNTLRVLLVKGKQDFPLPTGAVVMRDTARLVAPNGGKERDYYRFFRSGDSTISGVLNDNEDTTDTTDGSLFKDMRFSLAFPVGKYAIQNSDVVCK